MNGGRGLAAWIQGGCLFVLFMSIVVVTALGIWLFSQTPTPPTTPWPTAIIWTPTPTPSPPPTAIPTPVSVDGITVGTRVRVTGTGGAGLSIRAEAGLEAERLEIAPDGAGFIIIGGPAEADGLLWWRVRDVTNPHLEGWAAADYLTAEEEEKPSP